MKNARMRWWLMLSLLCSVHAMAAIPNWYAAAGGTDYQLTAVQGDVQSGEGAQLRLTAVAARTAPFGAASAQLDAVFARPVVVVVRCIGNLKRIAGCHAMDARR
ncbi:hypothetical protein [Xanthomonas hortorum]|uniref:hypothetical protein n=1 Tax=Xanthomonas hortorum TaxID=56454 RepID=UPI0021139016|nr:hypothetical protein [Xanthomonas hortorum]UUE97192.1 hypothetical protein NDY24_14905 [Xanthomonas hortorum pv. pelargonii]UUF01277.1 hypothetical protein NDY25_15045 [Xanthomonas hortorum pv. pelargonii]